MEQTPKEEAEKLKPILERFVEGYKAKAFGASDEEWLFQCYQKELPERTEEELAELVTDTLSSVAEYDRNLKEVECAAKQGISAEKWFASAVACPVSWIRVYMLSKLSCQLRSMKAFVS